MEGLSLSYTNGTVFEYSILGGTLMECVQRQSKEREKSTLSPGELEETENKKRGETSTLLKELNPEVGINGPPLPQEKVAFLSTYRKSNLKVYEIKGSVTLGRASSSQIRLADSQVSSQHLRIDLNHRGAILRDLQSTYGTLVNNTKVISCYLKPGDRIQVSKFYFIFGYREQETKESWACLTSKNRAWQSQLSRLPQIAHSEFTVLITGASGTGKERIAQFIHEHSVRKNMPIINVNCSALSESLVESELFGHKKGSFTGANEDRLGAFQAAKEGTLFLDEVGRSSPKPSTQVIEGLGESRG